MSSNAFARSRPRVRHQRVPKTHSYSHPRFLQLCKELARLHEVKEIQEASSSQHCRDLKNDREKVSKNTTNSDCSHACNSIGLDHSNNDRRCQLAQQTASCASIINNIEAHSSNGFRSIECNHNPLYHNYYRQIHHTNNSHEFNEHTHRNSCANALSLNQHQYQLQEPNRLSNTSAHHDHHQQHHNHQNQHNLIPSQACQTKFAPMNMHQMNSPYTRVNQVKIVLPAHVSSTMSAPNNSDEQNARQDENRSKRKRSSSNELSAQSSKKVAPSSGSVSPSCVTNGKKHKPCSEAARPLSPSFTKCPICLLDCMDRDPSFTNTCFHLFCYVCIESWSKSKATCPLCRTKFSKIIYNIRSAGSFDEKIASPIRRDDDDDRIIYEHLQSITSNPSLSSHQPTTRSQHSADEPTSRLSLDGLRPNDVLMPPFPFVNSQLDYQQFESLHHFSIMSNGNNNNTINVVPHASTFNSYNPYVTLIPTPNSTSRLHPPVTNTAITSAYAPNPGITSISSTGGNSDDPSGNVNRLPRVSRSGRSNCPRSFDISSPLEGSNLRLSRSTSSNAVSTTGNSISLERHHSHVQPQHQHGRLASTVVSVGPSINLPPRSSGSTMELGTLVTNVPSSVVGRQGGHRAALHSFTSIPYSIAPPHLDIRRPQQSMPVVDQHIFNSLYGASQEPM